MDSPIRKTRPEDMFNVRQEVRGGKMRTVWDEKDANGKIVKTAVWDLTDRNGVPIGEQSWDEYELYIDRLREEAARVSDPTRHIRKLEDRRKKREEAAKAREERARRKRTELAAVLEYFAEEHEAPISQMPMYKFIEELLPYFEKMGMKPFSARKVSMTMRRNKEFFESMGFTFSSGWSKLSRTVCFYVGYLTSHKIEDERTRESRDELLVDLVAEIPSGTYSRLSLAALLSKRYKRTSSYNLGWILARNARKYGLWYRPEFDEFVKE